MAKNNMTKILLFADSNCISCDSAAAELRRLTSSRHDANLVIFRRPQDVKKFREYNIAICPAVFVDDKFISYGTPDTSKIESTLDARIGNQRKTIQSKTKSKGDLK